MKVTVNNCARCGKTHEIEFRKFSEKSIEVNGKTLTHWAMCTNVNEPVLLMLIEPTDSDYCPLCQNHPSGAHSKDCPLVDNETDVFKRVRVSHTNKYIPNDISDTIEHNQTKNGNCFKCGQDTICKIDQQEHELIIAAFMRVSTSIYVCTSCGYVETYVEDRKNIKIILEYNKHIET